MNTSYDDIASASVRLWSVGLYLCTRACMQSCEMSVPACICALYIFLMSRVYDSSLNDAVIDTNTAWILTLIWSILPSSIGHSVLLPLYVQNHIFDRIRLWESKLTNCISTSGHMCQRCVILNTYYIHYIRFHRAKVQKCVRNKQSMQIYRSELKRWVLTAYWHRYLAGKCNFWQDGERHRSSHVHSPSHVLLKWH